MIGDANSDYNDGRVDVDNQVKSEQEALNLLYGGELMRTTAQHNLNKKSNRSHSIFTVYVTQRAKSGVSEKVSCLLLVCGPSSMRSDVSKVARCIWLCLVPCYRCSFASVLHLF